MRDRERQIRICRVLILMNLCFIWGNSLLPAEISQAFSDWVRTMLGAIAPVDGENPIDGGVLRKMAHFTEFAALGFLLKGMAVLIRKKYPVSLPLGMAAACVDEMIQNVVPGRSPGILDVLIDSCGVLTGILLLQTGYYIFKQYQIKHYGG